LQSSTVGGEQTTEDDPEGEDEEMEEAAEEEIHHSGQGEELRHGAPQSASSDEDIVRLIGEKTNWEIKKLKQKSWVRNNSINYIYSFFIVANVLSTQTQESTIRECRYQ
jgi:hypothetical protein